MSKLGCACGNTIVDQTDSIPYKAKFVCNQDWEAYSDWTDDVDSFINAIKSGERESWIQNYFEGGYPTDLKDSSVIFDIISRNNTLEGVMYQCEKCSRVKIEISNTNSFASFMPEDDECRDIFKRK